MKDEKDNNLDRVFKEGLSKAEDNIAYRNDDWDAMEQLLDEQKKRRGIIFRLPVIIGAIAAMLLLALGFFFLRPELKTDTVKNTARVKPAKGNTVQSANNNEHVAANGNTPALNPAANPKNTITNQTAKGPSTEQQIAVQPAATTTHRETTADGSKPFKNNITGINQPNNGSLPTIEQPIANNSNNDKAVLLNAASQPEGGNKLTDLQSANGTGLGDNSLNSLSIASLNAIDKQLDTKTNSYAVEVKKKERMKLNSSFGVKHPIVLSVLAAPDFNGVNSSFARTQVGTTAGMTLSIGLTKKLTISTGALYAKKPYMVPFSEYTTGYNFKTQPTDVYADCRVLDIPINIDYRLYNKGGNRFSVGTGLSSYFMLRENYHFDYDNTGSYNGPSDYNIKNQNQHIMGVLNVNATYQRRVSAKFGVNVQPYMKVPLTDIGYGKVNLQSTGLAVGVSWYLTSGPR